MEQINSILTYDPIILLPSIAIVSIVQLYKKYFKKDLNPFNILIVYTIIASIIMTLIDINLKHNLNLDYLMKNIVYLYFTTQGIYQGLLKKILPAFENVKTLLKEIAKQ